MTASLIKASEKDEKAKKMLAENLNLITNVILRVVQTTETWQNKKVKKTGLCVILFVKAAKLILKDKKVNQGAKEQIVTEGARLVKALDTAIEGDKTMSNLKGKIKEI